MSSIGPPGGFAQYANAIVRRTSAGFIQPKLPFNLEKATPYERLHFWQTKFEDEAFKFYEQNSDQYHGFILHPYKIINTTYLMQQPHQWETHARTSRVTHDGRTLFYHLEVLQQPERARACGNGLKSINDRRPVDPPPVVRLTLTNEKGEEITRTHTAGMICFASLVHSRPVVNNIFYGTNQAPILSGNSVAAAAYLEKPQVGAYFVFSDLAIRHEGQYRLKFDLFEQIRCLNDMDRGSHFQEAITSTLENPLAPHVSELAVNRMMVYSLPFQSFSAKKFPGLSVSTDLSIRLVDQGCRIRIRREVRLRR
ncbi:hypothetical protein LTR66_017751, partial [Elasticomyces elasticus]